MPTRVIGLLLFLPVPLVLFLFTRAPLGVLASLAVGVLLTLTPPPLRAPVGPRARAHALPVVRGGRRVGRVPGRRARDRGADGPHGWRACREAHARPVRAVVEWAAHRRPFLTLGILGSLAVFLAWGAGSGFGWPGGLAYDDAVAFLRLGIALSVLPLGWLAARGDAAPADALRAPFPLHVPALVGLRTVLWLFRLVGLVWLVQGSLHAVAARGFSPERVRQPAAVGA